MATQVSGIIEQVQPKGSSGTKYAIASTAYGYCQTAANQKAKTVDMTGFKLIKGVTIHVKFQYNNTAAEPPTLNVNGTGALNIVQYGTTAIGTADETTSWHAGAVVSFTYDGTSWVRDQGFNTNSQSAYGNITTSGTLDTALQAVVTDSNKKITTADLTVSDDTTIDTTATSFVAKVTQAAQGQITVTKAALPTASTDTAGITKVGASGGAAAYSHTHDTINCPSLTTEANIESGTRSYQGSGSTWTGSITSMQYAGILQICGGYSRGWQIWATRGNNNTESLHWRNPNGDATAWNEERIIIDSGNYKSYAWARPSSITTDQVILSNGTDGSTTLRAILNNTSVEALGWNSGGSTNTNNLRLVDVNTIAYWNGAYSGTTSNLSVLGTVTTGIWNASVIGAAYGGTGQNTLQKSANVLINALDTGSSDLTSNDYVITQYVGGGTTTTTYHRRPASKVVNATLVKAALGTDTSTTTQWLNKKGLWSTPTAADVGAITKLSSSTDNAIVRFDGTSGAVQNSGVTIDDNNNVTIPGTALKVTAESGGKYILLGNQNSYGENCPVILEGVNGSLYIGNGTSWSSNTGGTLSTAIYMSKDRKVGIGTTSPSYTLDVNGTGRFQSELTLYRSGTTTQNYPARINFSAYDSTLEQTNNGYIAYYNDHTTTYNGTLVVSSGGTTLVGAGESAATLYSTLGTTYNSENLFLTADSNIFIYAYADTAANRVGFKIDTSGHILPQKAEEANSNVQTLGASGNVWKAVYATDFYGGGSNITLGTASAAVVTDANKKLTTRSIKNMTSAGNLGWASNSTDNTILTTNTLAYWNGRYNSTSSNLEYYKGGAFGTMAKETAADYAKLASPSFTGTPTAPTAADGTNTTQIATTAFVMSQFKYNDAMIYKGVVNANADLPATHYQGWTYKVATAGTYAGIACEIGDMIICNTDGTSANNAHWNVIQTNIDGAVIGPAAVSSGRDNSIVRFNGETGKLIQDSKITIDDNGNLLISHATSATMTADSTNPKITFAENGSQPVHLIYSDYDSYRSPAGLKIIGGTSAIPAWLEVEGNVYAAAFKGKADTAYHTTAAHWSTQAGSPTGVLKIKIKKKQGWMLAFTIRVYQAYSYDDYVISGYNYGSNKWYSPEVTLLGSDSTSKHTVTFGYDDDADSNGYRTLWVSIPVQQYTGIDIFNVTNGFTQITDMSDAFEIIHETESTGTIQTTVDCYRPWYRNETVSDATTATNLSAKPSLAASGNNITVTAGEKTSDAFTVPYATSAGSASTISTTGGTTATFWRGDNSWSDTINGGTLKITNNSNTVTIGSQNTSFTHIYNSATIPFIFNNTVLTTSGNLGSTTYPFNNLYIGAKGSKGIYYVGTNSTNQMITFVDNTSDGNGNGIKIGGGGVVVIGSGESSALSVTGGDENLYLIADSIAYLEANAQTLANRIGISINASGHIIPVKAEVANNNAQNLGSSSAKWANVYATTFTGDLSGNASSATRINGNLGLLTDTSQHNIWVSSTNSADGIPKYVTGVYVTASTGVITANGFRGSLSGNAATASKISAKLAATTKTYLLGTSTAITATAANVEITGDTGVYLTTTAGELSAARHSWNVSGTEKAYTVYNTTDDSIDFVFI